MAILNDVFESAQLMQSLADRLIHLRRAAVIFRIGHLHGPKLEQIDDLRSVRQIAVKLPPPTRRRIARPMRHDIEMNFGVRIVFNAGAKQIERKKIHLLGPDRRLKNVILAPRHGHAAFAKERNPLVRVAQIKMRVVRRVVGADQGVRQPLFQYIC